MSALSLVSPPKLGGARGGLKERYNSNCSDQPAHTGTPPRSALSLATAGSQESLSSVAQNGPYPMQLVVVMAVKNAVSAATTTFTAISTIRFFIC